MPRSEPTTPKEEDMQQSQKYSVLLVILGLLSLAACTPSDGDITIATYGPLCALGNSSGNIIYCMEYKMGTSSTTVEADCTQLKNDYGVYGASIKETTESGSFFYCDKPDIIGKCKLSNGLARFYSAGFTEGQAQSECTSLGGTYQ